MNRTEGDTRATATRRWLPVAVVVVAVAIAAGAYALGRDQGADSTTEQQMAARAQQVMPFDLNQTTHTFTKTASGGIQTVVAKDASDTRNRGLIRSHLQEEAAQFREGNYSDPATIHGMDMPGVEELQQAASRVEVVYSDVPNGGRLTYSSTEPGVVDALHAWFDRQASDHSAPGMGG